MGKRTQGGSETGELLSVAAIVREGDPFGVAERQGAQVPYRSTQQCSVRSA
jgi:hypothetical protein